MDKSDNSLPINSASGERLSFIICRNSHGVELRGTLHRLTRHLAVFEVYNPYSIVQLSEVLGDFRIMMNERMIYTGRAVIANLVNTGIMLICEASLAEEGWIDVGIFSPLHSRDHLQNDLLTFLKETEKTFHLLPEFKVVVADMHILLTDLRRWMEQVELGMRSLPASERLQAEREAMVDLQDPILPAVMPLMVRFEESADKIPDEVKPIHRSYVKRQLHPLVLCAPFVYRTFQKPLGYAGDYEMVNMMLRDPYEGGSIFAKIINKLYLEIPPVIAHRNRITYLVEQLRNESERAISENRAARIYNLGCGPAQEIQNFLASEAASDSADFLLLDFNDETVTNTSRNLQEIRTRYQRETKLQLERKSVHQVLKEFTKPAANAQPGTFDLVYCAGLFDYLSDRICRRLLEIFYDLLAPGGLLIATNVHPSNPWQNWMEYLAEWHLEYRDEEHFRKLAPERAPPESVVVKADVTGVNIFLEIRKPLNG